MAAVEKRKQAKESGTQYYEEEAIALSQCLPKNLRAHLDGLTRDQMRIYEDFEPN